MSPKKMERRNKCQTDINKLENKLQQMSPTQSRPRGSCVVPAVASANRRRQVPLRSRSPGPAPQLPHPALLPWRLGRRLSAGPYSLLSPGGHASWGNFTSGRQEPQAFIPWTEMSRTFYTLPNRSQLGQAPAAHNSGQHPESKK